MMRSMVLSLPVHLVFHAQALVIECCVSLHKWSRLARFILLIQLILWCAKGSTFIIVNRKEKTNNKWQLAEGFSAEEIERWSNAKHLCVASMGFRKILIIGPKQLRHRSEECWESGYLKFVIKWVNWQLHIETFQTNSMYHMSLGTSSIIFWHLADCSGTVKFNSPFFFSKTQQKRRTTRFGEIGRKRSDTFWGNSVSDLPSMN
jgi:hypothetical protein